MLAGIGRLVSHIGFALGVLSLVMLIKQGFDIGFAEPLRLLLEYYRALVDLILGWTDPYIQEMLNYISKWITVDIHLHPHWKHIFIPLWLYCGVESRMEWYKNRRTWAIVNVPWGGFMALAASIAAGVVPLDDPNLLPVVFPVAGIAVYEFIKSLVIATFYGYPGQTWWQTARYYVLRTAVADTVMGGAIIFLGFRLKQMGHSVSNLGLLIVFVVGLAIRQIGISLWVATTDRPESVPWKRRFQELAGQRVGRLVLLSLGAAALVIAFNAGLRLTGL